MKSSQKTIDAAVKAAATCKSRALKFIQANQGTQASVMPRLYKRWLRALETAGAIEYRNGGWYAK